MYAKYVLGSDGAHSWVRKSLGFTMDGEQTGMQCISSCIKENIKVYHFHRLCLGCRRYDSQDRFSGYSEPMCNSFAEWLVHDHSS